MSLVRHSPGRYSKQSSKHPGINQSWAPLLRCPTRHISLWKSCAWGQWLSALQRAKEEAAGWSAILASLLLPMYTGELSHRWKKPQSPGPHYPPGITGCREAPTASKPELGQGSQNSQSSQKYSDLLNHHHTHLCTDLHSIALSSPSSVLPQCLRALVPVPALFPCTHSDPGLSSKLTCVHWPSSALSQSTV